MKKSIRLIGALLIGLIVLGQLTKVIPALLAGIPFYGENFYGVPLGTYTTLSVFAVACLVGVIWLVRLGNRWSRRRNHLFGKGD